LPVTGKGSGDQIKEESQADDPNKIERTSTETGKNVFNNYNLSNESERGYYFERIQQQHKEPEKESLKKPNTGYESSDTQKEEPQKINESDSNLKRERKKIDIANPDIIENFFRTSDD
jgi:hypothetical protein